MSVVVRSPFSIGLTDRFRVRMVFQKLVRPPAAGETEEDYLSFLDSVSILVGPFQLSVPGDLQRYSMNFTAARDAAQFIATSSFQFFGNLDTHLELVNDAGEVVVVSAGHPLAVGFGG